MKKEKKNKLIALFIVFMFVGSGIAYAIISALTPAETQEQSYIVNKPLTNSEEAYFLQRNVVILRYYYSEDCFDCPSTEPIVDTLGELFQGWVFIEKINVDEYPEESADYTVPTIYLKGKTTKEITSNFDINEIYLDICTMFFAPVQQCSI